MVVSLILIIGVIILKVGYSIYCWRIGRYVASLDLEDPSDYRKAAEFCFGPLEKLYTHAIIILSAIDDSTIHTAYDFSLWESKRIIGMYVHDRDGPPRILLNQTVGQYKDGTILWLPERGGNNEENL